MEKVAGGTTTTFTYDGEDILREIAGATTTNYLHGPGIDEPLAKEVSGSSTYYHADGLGSVLKLTNASGSVTHEYRYDAYGNIEAGSTQAGYSFTGREWDPETKLYYYRTRYYDPESARFISGDPVGLRGGANLYGYVVNSPVNYIDPSGLYLETAADIAFIGYDIYNLINNLTSDCPNGTLGGDLLTLGLDVLGAVLPFVAGLGMAARFGDEAVEVARHTPDQQALKELVDEATNFGRKPLSRGEAETVLDWADEVGYPGARATPGDVASPSNWTSGAPPNIPPGQPHIHLPGAGRNGHVPVEPGVGSRN